MVWYSRCRLRPLRPISSSNGTASDGFFYRVLRISERFDLWLNLHGAAELAETDPDGLFGVSEAGSDSLLGALEQMTRGGDEPRRPVEVTPAPTRLLEEDHARSREAM